MVKGGHAKEGACMAGGACMARGYAWQEGVCVAGGCMAKRACVAGGVSDSGRYASYWNAFLCFKSVCLFNVFLLILAA